MDPIAVLCVLGGAVTGLVACVVFFSSRWKKSRRDAETLAALQADHRVLAERLLALDRQREELRHELDQARTSILQLTSSNADAQAVVRSLRDRNAEQQTLLESLQGTFAEGFEHIARRVLVESARDLTVNHRTALQEVLSPLKETVDRFQDKVETTHREAIRDHQSLRDQLAQLQATNQTIGEEARDLANALRGEAKTRGIWGEMILERLLEQSGLVRDREYLVQDQHVGQDGRRLQPDVIVLLPGNRHVVIDAKVSLVGYERYCSSDTPEGRMASMKDHVESVRRHIRELSGKSYEQLASLRSPDFVLMFVPIEPALMDAVGAEPALCTEATERNVLLVSRSSLLAMLRVIGSFWSVERLNRNAAEIARKAGELYDKFVGFVADVEEIGRRLEAAKGAHEAALLKLRDGRGNIVRRVEDLKDLGARTTRSLAPTLLDGAQEGTEDNLERS